ncbi:tetratricopeptide repeat protein [Solirubrobacter ginsenosidimutans]|uniref:Tetratricopeptide repeat protein n=1 Tax=Solirubrobacter ginsenosidimutans TaxID=490573 RepID=A0A9X3S0F4_9ACTN|nr:tetratricopeptide repeat protein [Solirubrobacter ginsenosidimutans]MDA0159166.1 tetratricopeptide repeat protein [Solirubrobacter ginsenosidimutans]
MALAVALTWLHLSDFHVRQGDGYDRDVVLDALVRSVGDLYERGRRPDVVFATGDVGFSGKAGEYAIASAFFEALLGAVRLDRSRLFVIAGNHDVDRGLGVGLARSLASREEADAYFEPSAPRPHLTQKQGAFEAWYRDFFDGVRDVPVSSCGPVELVEAGGVRLGVLAINSALFCQGDDDHAKLWVGRRPLERALRDLQALGADVRVALIHHPLDWLADGERANVRSLLADGVDVVLRGHLHETDVEQVTSPQGGLVHLVAGAAYQTRRWPNRAMYVTAENGSLEVFPIRFEDSPRPVWTVDPSVFPDAPDYSGRVPLRGPATAEVTAAAASSTPDPSTAAFRSNVPSRRGLAFVGRKPELEELARRLDTAGAERVVVVSGAPGVGKSELAREFARTHRQRYPGGTFFIDATGEAAPVDLTRVAVNHLGVRFAEGLPLEDQCEQALNALSAAPALLIFDNVGSFEAIERWLPRAGMPCHSIITSVAEPREPGWSLLLVEPLGREDSVRLVEALAGESIARTYGTQLASAADGLPVQLCPAAATLAYEQRRGRYPTPDLSLIAEETHTSFSGVYARLGASERLLLHAAAGLNAQRVSQAELRGHLTEALEWSEREYADAVDACLDLHLLQGDQDVTIHQLLAAFVRSHRLDDTLGEQLAAVRAVQFAALGTLAEQLVATPADGTLAAALLGYALTPQLWRDDGPSPSRFDLHLIGQALVEIGQFEQARPWFEQAIEEARQGDVQGRIDHAGLGVSLHQVGYCHFSLGGYEQARPWFEQAVEEARQGDVQGRIDHSTLGRSLHQVGSCYLSLGEYEQALPWFEQAVENKRVGDVHARIDHESLGVSLHTVGSCYFSLGDFEEARPWFEQAVEEARLGDVHGRIDHASVGSSLHTVGSCYLNLGEYEQARPWFERAVEETRWGDVHGRIDHESLGSSLHTVGSCYLSLGEYEQARPWFEQAVEEARLGDVHGRIDHESLGVSLHTLGYCYFSLGEFEQARPWFEQAVEEARLGDVHGRIDHESLGVSLHQVGYCYFSLGEFEQARAWFEQAVEAKRLGGVHGRVDRQSLRTSLVSVADCLRRLGRSDLAPGVESEAEALSDPSSSSGNSAAARAPHPP